MNKLFDAIEIQSVYADSVMAVDCDGGELHLLKAGVIITHRCTLRCKLCAERTTQYKERYHPTLDYLKREIDAYFDLVDYTMKFEITGGEPTIRKDLPDLLQYMLKYREQFGRVRIITNGTLTLSNETIEALKLYGRQADVLIDSYGDLSVNALRNATILSANGLIHIFRDQSSNDHFGGWVDFGDMSRRHSADEAKALYKKCAISQKVGFGWRIKAGVLSPCAMTVQCIEFGIHTGDPNEYVDLFDANTTKEQKRSKMLRIFEADNLSACMYCNGLCSDSKRYKPAEQIER
jgi:organic radical activating enzyme